MPDRRVLLVRGFLQTAGCWRTIAQSLASQGYSPVTVEPEEHAIGEALRDGPAVVVAHSIGGIAALRALRSDAAPGILGLAAVDVPAGPVTAREEDAALVLQDALAEGIPTVADDALHILYAADTLGRGAMVVEGLRYTLLSLPPAHVEADLRRFRARLEPGDLPWSGATLIAHGVVDSLVPPYHGEYLREVLAAGDVLALDGGHMAPFEDIETFREALDSFLASVDWGKQR